nr:MAG TPA: hypothetical protein [Caudoviricetes sp.]
MYMPNSCCSSPKMPWFLRPLGNFGRPKNAKFSEMGNGLKNGNLLKVCLIGIPMWVIVGLKNKGCES